MYIFMCRCKCTVCVCVCLYIWRLFSSFHWLESWVLQNDKFWNMFILHFNAMSRLRCQLLKDWKKSYILCLFPGNIFSIEGRSAKYPRCRLADSVIWPAPIKNQLIDPDYDIFIKICVSRNINAFTFLREFEIIANCFQMWAEIPGFSIQISYAI